MSDFGLAVTLALVAAVLFGIGAQFSRLGLRSIDAQNGALISIAAATVLYWLAAPWQLETRYWSSDAVWLFAAVGVFRPALSTTCAMAGTAILGATISTTLASTAPFFGLLFGVLILGEALTLPLAAGTFCIIAGVMLLARRGKGDARRDWPTWALGLPLAAALIRVCAHLVTKIGMEEVPSPYFAGLVAYNASLAVALANALRRRQSLAPLLTNGDTLWFVWTGGMFGVAVLAMNMALRHGPLSVVAPLVSLESLVVLVLGVVVFKETRITGKVVTAVVMVVAGSVAITSRG